MWCNTTLPELETRWGALTPKLERLIHILDWVRIEEFVKDSWCGTGRPPHERAWLANAFVAKTVLNLPTTVALIDRLTVVQRPAAYLRLPGVQAAALGSHLLARL